MKSTSFRMGIGFRISDGFEYFLTRCLVWFGAVVDTFDVMFLNVLMPWLVLFATTFRCVLYFLAALLVFVDAGFCSFRHDDWYFLTRCLVPFDTVVGAF